MKIFKIIVLLMLTVVFTDNLIAQDKRERKAVEALQEKHAKRDNTDSLRTAHYNRQTKAVKKRIKKSYRKARRNHEGKNTPWYERVFQRRTKKKRRKRSNK
jgi:hypothetical protein